MDESKVAVPEDTKNVGGAIPASLYWNFKKAQAVRNETATEALINAIRLYIELQPGKEV